MIATIPLCLACARSSDQVPLMPVLFQGRDQWICVQYLPILIHKPEQLTGLLPGAEQLQPADHED